MKNQNFKSQNFRGGSYSTILTVFVIAIIIVVNLGINALPSSYSKFDFSEQKLFSITDQTKKVVKNLDTDVTIYLIAQNGKEDDVLVELLEKYKSLSSRLTVVKKDPAIYPSFVSNYTQESLKDNSLIVEAGKHTRVITYEEIYSTSYDTAGNPTSTQFKGEDMITSAVDYVTNGELAKMYVITGHGESGMEGSFKREVEQENIEVKELALSTAGSIPEDAACLFMQAPTKDINENEAKVLLHYLKNGGRLFYTSFYLKEETPNLDKVLQEYGVVIENGYVCEGDNNHYIQNFNNSIVPSFGSHDITDPLTKASSYVVVANGQNIKKLENVRSSVKITSLLRTTASAYNKSLKDKDSKELSIKKEDGDRTGTMNLAVAVSEKTQKGNAKIVVVTTPFLYNSEMNQYVSGGNYDFLLNAVSYLCEHESMISIRGKSVSSQSLVVSSGQSIAWMMGLMIVLPIGCLTAGMLVWQKRRKR